MPSRSTVIMQMLAALPSGEAITTDDVVKRLLNYGYDFGATATEQDQRIAVTKYALSYLVKTGKLAQGIVDGQRVWYRPAQAPCADSSTPPPALSTPAGQQGSQLAPWAVFLAVFATVFIVALCVLVILIGALRTW